MNEVITKGLAAVGAFFIGKKALELMQSPLLACPLATQDLMVNTENRDSAIASPNIMYGPINFSDTEEYFGLLAEMWNTTTEKAKNSRCANCVAFDISPRMQKCMPGKLSQKRTLEIAGKKYQTGFGYCWMHHFKCHSARSCRTWAEGGPITKDSISYGWQKRAKV
jgi:hypothetical protein